MKEVFIGRAEPQQEQPEVKEVITERVGIAPSIDSDVEPPIDHYAEIKGHPYTSEFLGIDIWNDITKGQINDVERYVIDEIHLTGLMPTIESYKEIMQKLFEYLDISPNEMESVKLEKLHGYVSVRNKSKARQENIKRLIKQINKEAEERQYAE